MNKKIEVFKIWEDVKSFDEALEIAKEYGETDIELDLKVVTTDETTSVPDQEWHQDGSHVRYFPKYSALWCEDAEEECPVTQIISTRVSDEVGEKYKDLDVHLDFKKTIDENKFFKFNNKAHGRLYAMKARKLSSKLIGKDDFGYYTRWCPFTILPEEDHKFFTDLILSREVTDIVWKPNMYLIMQNYATLHRRKPFHNLNGHRRLKRVYIR